MSSAQQIAFVGARLTDRGILDDRLAEGFVHHGDNAMAKTLMLPERVGLWPNRPFAYIAARTRFYDTVVNKALDAGTRQVVILGAGYDGPGDSDEKALCSSRWITPRSKGISVITPQPEGPHSSAPI